MRVRVIFSRLIFLILSVVYLASTSPYSFAALKLDHGHVHHARVVIVDGCLELVFSHHDEEDHYDHNSHDNNNSLEYVHFQPTDTLADHRLHFGEQNSKPTYSQQYSPPEAQLISRLKILDSFSLTPSDIIPIWHPGQPPPLSQNFRRSTVRLI